MEHSDNNMIGSAEHIERSTEKIAVETIETGSKQNGLDDASVTSKNGRRRRVDLAASTSTHKGGHSVIIIAVPVCIVIGVVIAVALYFKGKF